MQPGLFGFVFNTLLPRVNDPKNALFLPSALYGLDDPSIKPLRADSWDLGAIEGRPGGTIGGSIADGWWQAEIGPKYKHDPEELKKHQAIFSAWPKLSLSHLEIEGLWNVLVQPLTSVSQPGTGYLAVIPIEFGHYSETEEGLPMPQIHVNGHFSLPQKVCSTASGPTPRQPAPEACDGWQSATLVGRGTFEIEITELFIDATVKIGVDGAGAGRTLVVEVDQLAVRGAPAGTLPTLAVEAIKIDTKSLLGPLIWEPQAKKAIETSRAAFFESFSSTLNQEDNKRQIQTLLTTRLGQALDKVLGSAPPADDGGQHAPNPVDQYLFDRVRAALNDPSSEFYTPTAVLRFDSPKLEPYQPNAPIALGKQWLGPIELENIELQGPEDHTKGPRITGFANAVVPGDTLVFHESGSTSARIAVSTLTSPPPHVPPPPLELAAYFVVVPSGMPNLPGSIWIHVTASTVDIHLTASGGALADLEVTFASMVLSAANDAILVAKLQLPGADPAIVAQIKALMSTDSVKEKILSGINGEAHDHLAEISQAVTKNLKKLIAQKLDG
ncbi:MAG: hypothetical protein AAGC60_19590 [Acidobacteriota bacterium]